MPASRDRNVFGAFALMIADEIVRASSSFAPEEGPAAAALALLDHVSGLSIRALAAGVGLSHAGTVRLVDRLVADGLVERRGHAKDGRARALVLTPAGEAASAAVLAARDDVLETALASLDPDERRVLATLSERVLRARLRDEAHAYRICRLCRYAACSDCPIDDELQRRA